MLDGMDRMGLVILGHRSSKSIFGADNKMLRPGSGSRIPRCRPKSLSMSIHTVEFEKVAQYYNLHIKKIILVHGSVIFVNIVFTGIRQTRPRIQRCRGNRLTQGKHSCNKCHVSGP